MQAPASHLYHAQSINRSCSYLETSSIVIMKRYQGPGPLDIISCYLWLSGRDLRPGPATFIRDDMMAGCHGVTVMMSCHLITSRKLDSSNISLITHHCLRWLHDISLFVSSSPPLPPSHLSLSKVHLSLIWIRCSPLATPRLLIASPVSQWTSPLSAQRLQFLILKNRCCFPRPQPWPAQFSNQDRCPLYKLCPGWPCLPAGHQRNFTFLAQSSVKMVKSCSKNIQ